MADLLATDKKLTADIASLRENIQERSSFLEAQARSAQVNNSTMNYLNAIINSKSITNAIQKVTAMATVTTANKNMIEQQQADMTSVTKKLEQSQKDEGKAVKAQNKLAQQNQALLTQQAQLKVAQTNYQLTITTAEGKKSELLAQKAAEEKAAAATAAKVKAEQEAVKAANSKPIPPAPSSSNNTSSSNAATATASSNSSSNSSTPGSYSSTNIAHYMGCTEYVKGAFGSRVGDVWGDGKDWANSARSDGFTVDFNPVAGSTVAVFGPGQRGGDRGHVAVVESVDKAAGTMKIGEAIDLGNGYFNTESDVPISLADLGFIHV
ncbi:CHAP domain-containing protein [Lactococcus nasutitermitis]|uniref:CHAP domain-containing protein n=1 Tax=Lactococcus nasutitermitis TaxID=1652957 RepID=A0ABV9JIE1_9LACT|nr:CHAP domain-containing protein [Lactococcus nasutitermitis]